MLTKQCAVLRQQSLVFIAAAVRRESLGPYDAHGGEQNKEVVALGYAFVQVRGPCALGAVIAFQFWISHSSKRHDGTEIGLYVVTTVCMSLEVYLHSSPWTSERVPRRGRGGSLQQLAKAIPRNILSRTSRRVP